MNRMSENTSKITKKHKFECQGETTSVLHRKRNNSIYLKEVEQMTKIPQIYLILPYRFIRIYLKILRFDNKTKKTTTRIATMRWQGLLFC